MSEGSTEGSRRLTRLGFLGVALLLVAKAALAHWLVIGDARPMAVAFDAAFVVAVLGAFDAMLFRARAVGWVVADALLSALMLTAVLYASYYGQVLTPAQVALAGQVGEVGSSVTSLLRPVYLVFVLDIPVLAVVLWLARARVSRRFDPWLAGVAAVSAAVMVFAVVSIVRIPESIDGVTASRGHGLYAYQLASMMRDEDELAATDSSAAVSPEALQAQIDASDTVTDHRRVGDVLPGAAKGRNVIVIQVEALQGVVMGKTIDGAEITPNFNRFAADGYYFPNTFSQIGKGNTSDAEFVAASSLYPPLEKAASLAYSNREITGLPRLLGSQGYRTLTFHTNDATFWNRTQLYPALGFDRYYDRRFFGNKDIIGMGPSDEVLYAKTLAELKKVSASREPFYTQIITLTSHDPFDPMPASKRPYLPTSPYAGTSVGRYITRINYADRAFGKFISDLKASGLYDSSVIVVYGDHFALKHTETGGAEGAAQLALVGHTYTQLDRLRVPMIVHIPGQTAGLETTMPVSQLDVMPTVADLLGVDATSTPHFGRSVFSDQRPLFGIASAPLGAFVNDRIFFVPGLGFDDGHAVLVATGAPASTNASDAADFSESKLVRQLSAAYVATLKKRAGAAVDPHAFIPTGP